MLKVISWNNKQQLYQTVDVISISNKITFESIFMPSSAVSVINIQGLHIQNIIQGTFTQDIVYLVIVIWNNLLRNFWVRK